MMEIIPAINVRTFEEVEERIKKIEPYAEWCHLDVTDGIFSKHLTWHNPQDLPRIRTKLKIEAHLMIARPEEFIEGWLVRPVKRVLVHTEAVKGFDFVIKKAREAKIEIGAVLNPETFWGKLEPWFDKVDLVAALEVHPGPSGQPIAEDAFEKIAAIRKSCPKCVIEFDGGINPASAKKAAEAGTDILVSGAYIFNSSDIAGAIKELKESAGKKD